MDGDHAPARTRAGAKGRIASAFERAARFSRSGFGQWAARIDLSRTRQYEGEAVWRFARTLVTAPADQEALLKLARHARKPMNARETVVDVVPNGVDLDYSSL